MVIGHDMDDVETGHGDDDVPGHGLAALTSAIITIQTVMSSFLKDVTLIYIQKIIVITNFYLSS